MSRHPHRPLVLGVFALVAALVIAPRSRAADTTEVDTWQPAPYSLAELTPLAEHCTKQEDAANKVERRVRKSAAALWLSDRVGQEFAAVVTGASEKGTWVRLDRPLVEGKLDRGYEGLDVGDRIRVRLVKTDAERGFVDFVRV
jgi:exoribonuclease-2